MLSNFYIEDIMQFLPGFVGVFSSDNAPLLRKPKTCLIMNFDKSFEPGSHFVGFYLDENYKCFYFDSLDIQHIPKDVSLYAKSYHKIENISKPIQSYNSTYCGFFCMLFITSMFVGRKFFKQMMKEMKERELENDEKCIRNLCSAITKIFEK